LKEKAPYCFKNNPTSASDPECELAYIIVVAGNF
jgi:hypothetical protein